MKQPERIEEQYRDTAAGWSVEQYADSAAYLRHRAELVVSLGPRLEPGDRVLDLACGDGGLAEHLDGFEYLGVDANPAMVAVSHGITVCAGGTPSTDSATSCGDPLTASATSARAPPASASGAEPISSRRSDS